MYLRSSEVGHSSKTWDTVSTPELPILSERHTIKELSRPPLSSANTGRSDRNLQRTASLNAARACSLYSSSVRYRIFLQGSSFQKRCVETCPCDVTLNTCAGFVAVIFVNGVSW